MTSEPSENKPEKRSSSLLPLYFSIVLALGLSGGYYLSKRVNTATIASANYHQANGNKMSSLMNYIEKHYVDTIDPKELEEKGQRAVERIQKEHDPKTHAARLSEIYHAVFHQK